MRVIPLRREFLRTSRASSGDENDDMTAFGECFWYVFRSSKSNAQTTLLVVDVRRCCDYRNPLVEDY